MYQNKITLMPQDILEKEFKIDTRGYRLKEVDQFLDIIIGDYEQFFNIINGLEKEKADLLTEVMSLKQELRNSKLNMEVSRGETPEMTNVDIIKRVSQLEKVVYGLKNSIDKELALNTLYNMYLNKLLSLLDKSNYEDVYRLCIIIINNYCNNVRYLQEAIRQEKLKIKNINYDSNIRYNSKEFNIFIKEKYETIKNKKSK